MATEIGRGVIPVTFDKDQIGRDLSSSIEGGARASEGAIGSTFKRLAGIATAAFAGVQVVGFFKDSVEGAREANRIASQTEAVIKSTGGAAGLTADQFSKLAESISLKTGIDDEQIQSAENLLATFTNLKDGVGDGNDIFSQATQAAVDMGAALGGDASSNAIQLGKALNNPVAGISALTRVGVAFTDEQKNLIKSLQESGDMAGAQKVILAELNKEFGGSAEATATAGAKFSVFWGNLQEKVGNFLIPMLDKLATWAMTTLPAAFGVMQGAIGPVIESIGQFWSTLTTGFTEDEGTPIERLALSLRDNVLPIIQTVADGVAQFWGTITTGFTDQDVATPVEQFALILRNDLWPIIQTIAGFITDNWQPILLGVVTAFGLLTAPITTIVVGLGVLYAKSQTFRDIIERVREGLVSFGKGVQQVAGWLNATFGPAIAKLGSSLADLARFFADRWEKIRGAVVTVLNAIKIQIGIFIAPILLAWNYFHEQILAVVQVVWDQIGSIISTAARVIGDVFDVIISLLTGDWGGAWDAAKDIPAAFVDFVKGTLSNLLTFAIDFFSSLPGNIISAVGDLLGLLVPKGIELLQGLVAGLVAGALAIGEWFVNLPATIVGYIVDAGTWLIDKGKEILAGLVLGLVLGAADVFTWFQNLPTVLAAYFVDAASWLIQVGKDLVAGIVRGIRESAASIGQAIHDALPFSQNIPTPTRDPVSGQYVLPTRNAAGTNFFAGGLSWVGEEGPELVRLPRGTQIFSNPKSLAMLGAAGGNGNTYQMTSGPVYVQEAEDAVTAFRRLELMSGVGR